MFLRCWTDLGLLGAFLGGSVAAWSRLGKVLVGASWSISEAIEDAYGESPPSPAFRKRLCGRTLWPQLGTLSDCVFPQPLWEPFGEDLGEEAKEDERAFIVET